MVSVVIPTLNAGPDIEKLLEALTNQTCPPDEICIIDSSSTDNTRELVAQYASVSLITISKSSFDHGGTRNLGLRSTRGQFVVFMTQDALPANTGTVEELLKPFSNDKVALVTARQLPRKNARRFEQLVRSYRYPPTSNIRSASDIKSTGIKAFFASDVCSAYRRDALESIGGFPEPCKTNEDMLAAERLLRSGYLVAYEAESCVFHSHNFTLREQYKRNHLIGEFLNEYSAELGTESEVGEGAKLAKFVLNVLVSEHDYSEAAAFIMDCGARFLGNRMGRFHHRSICQ